MEIPGPPTHPPPNESQRSMDDQIRRLEEHLRDLKSQRNARAEISKLPDDVLLDIFKIAKASEMSPLNWSLDWLKVTFVCRHWRNVALTAHTLWASPPTHRHDLALTMLERSKACDMDVIFTTGADPRTIEAILYTNNYIKRIRALSITRILGTAMSKIQDVMQTRGGSQRLQKLAITILCREEHEDDFAFSASAFGPIDQLLSLSLETLRFSWNILPLPRLTQLCLMKVRFTEPVSLDMLLECLRGMPALQRLKLFLSDFGDAVPQTMTQKLVELPCLTIFKVYHSAPRNMEYLLSHLTLPRLENLSIFCASSIHGFSPLVTAISRKLISGNFGTLDYLAAEQQRVLLTSSNQPNSSLDLLFAYALDDQGILYLLRDCIMELNQTVRGGFQFLEVSDIWPTNSHSDFLLLFGELHSLTTITAKRDPLAEALIHSLNIPQDHHNVTTPVPFPKLFGIRFEETKLSPLLLDTLQTNLQQRTVHCGRGINTLSGVPEN